MSPERLGRLHRVLRIIYDREGGSNFYYVFEDTMYFYLWGKWRVKSGVKWGTDGLGIDLGSIS